MRVVDRGGHGEPGGRIAQGSQARFRLPSAMVQLRWTRGYRRRRFARPPRLDDAFGPTTTVGEMLAAAHSGRNPARFPVARRQSAFRRLAGREDMNDAERLVADDASPPSEAWWNGRQEWRLLDDARAFALVVCHAIRCRDRQEHVAVRRRSPQGRADPAVFEIGGHDRRLAIMALGEPALA